MIVCGLQTVLFWKGTLGRGRTGCQLDDIKSSKIIISQALEVIY